jgi:hypothetical protein
LQVSTFFYDGNQNQDYDQYINRGTSFPATHGKWSELVIGEVVLPSGDHQIRISASHTLESGVPGIEIDYISVRHDWIRFSHMSAINEDELKARLDPLSYEVLRNGATERPFTGDTQIQIKSEAIVAKHVALNYLKARLSFIQDVAGHRSMLHS